MSYERSFWHCSNCDAYRDPQSLDYETGLCWDCLDTLSAEDIMEYGGANSDLGASSDNEQERSDDETN